MVNFKSFVDGQTKRIYYNQNFNCDCGKEYSIVNSIMITPKLKADVYGMGSRTRNGLHILFCDYDEKDKFTLGDIVAELKRVQEKHFLSHWFIFQRPRTKSFHAVCPTTHTLQSAFSILQDLSVDLAFVNAPKFFQGKQWILGSTNKGERPAHKFIKLVKSPHQDRKTVSNAHVLFLEKYYKAPKLLYINKDKFKTIPLIKYKTGNRLK